MFGVIAGGFAIFAGFIIFLAFTTYDQSRSGSETEALTLVQQFQPRSSSGRHEAALTGEIVCYGRSVVYQEWPLMEAGNGSDAINPWTIALFRSLKLVNPKSASEQAAYSKWLDETSDREVARQDRLHGAEGITPGSIWLVLFLIAGVIFAFMLFFADSGEGRGTQAMLIGSATTVIVLTLMAINALDSPYRPGLGQIEPVAMKRALRILNESARRRERPRSVALQCERRSGDVVSEDAPPRGFFDRHFELLRRPSLSMAAVATAWSGYQAARWHGEQARAQSASIAARVESTRAANVANRQGEIDVALFTQWVDAYARDEVELAAFYRKRFRPEFQPAFNAWVATKPRKNPDAPLSPFALPEYKLAANATAERLEATAARFSVSVGRFIQRADNYSLAVVLFATSLFFAGISTRLRSSKPQLVILGLGYTLFLGALIWLATFPVSLDV